MAAISRSMGPSQWAMLVTLAVLWGGSFFFAEYALVDIPPFTLVFLRVLLGAIFLHLVIVATGRRFPVDMKLWGALALMGLINNAIPFSLIFWGQTEITGGLASILNATTPLWTVLVAHFFTSDESMSLNRLAGVIIGFIGVAVMIGPELLGDIGRNLYAQIAVLMAALTYAFAGVYGRRFQGVQPMTTAAGQLTASSLWMLPVALYVDAPWRLPLPGMPAVIAVLFLAILASGVAYILYFRLLASAGATNLLLVTFLVPVSAIILGAIFLAETLSLNQITGMLLIAAGLAAIDGRIFSLWKRKRPT